MNSDSPQSPQPHSPPSMRYGMIGDDCASDNEKIAKYMGEVDWSYLRPHYERDCLYFIDPTLDMPTVGVAFAQDDSAAVSAWLKSGELVKIEAIHAFQWEETEQQFEALVVSPFVLCRTI